MEQKDIEKERGIKIIEKEKQVVWKNKSINIVDKKGKEDLGGEVESIIQMVDGEIVIVDDEEGKMKKKKLVVGKEMKVGIKNIVEIKKIESKDGRNEEVVKEVLEIFENMEDKEEKIDLKIIYG